MSNNLSDETLITDYEENTHSLPSALSFVTDAINYPLQFEAQLPEDDYINELLKALSILKKIESSIPTAKEMLQNKLKNMDHDD